MGVVNSKSPLERRNTVLRRSQRKSIHGIKSKADKIIKDIKKFKGVEEDSAFVDLKAKIEGAERDLRHHVKNLQPQIRPIYNETLKKTETLHKLLEDKLKENQEKEREKLEKQKEIEKENEKEVEKTNDDGEDDVFVEEITEEQDQPLERKTVQLKVIQVEQIEASPQINKRFSAMKIGVPVMPGSIMESLHRKTSDLNAEAEEKIAGVRKEIEKLEMEISQFVGKRNGKYYNRIKDQLDAFSNDLKSVISNDEAIWEQLRMCKNYIDSCLSFLNEKAVDGGDDDDDDDEEEYVMTNNATEIKTNVTDNNLSPRSARTTYI